MLDLRLKYLLLSIASLDALSSSPSNLAASRLKPQIGLPHAVVREQFRPGALEHGASRLHDIGAIGDLQRGMGVLLDQEDRDALRLELLHRTENLGDKEGREP